MATGFKGGGSVYGQQPAPPGNQLLATEQAATARQEAGKNPSVTPGELLAKAKAILEPKPLTVNLGGKQRPVNDSPIFTPATATLDTLAHAVPLVENAHQQAVKLAHGQGNPLTALLSGALGVPRMGVNEPGMYEPRTLTHNDLTVQVPKVRSRITRGLIESPADRASQALQNTPHVTDLPGARLLTTQERVAKAAGRAQRIENVRQAARMGGHLNEIKHVKAGSPEDVAHFWWAQLPEAARNVSGLRLVRAKQAQALEEVTSGKALADLNAAEGAVKAKLGAIEDPADRFPLMQQLEDIRILKSDLPQRAQDTAASIAQLDKTIEANPSLRPALIDAVKALGENRSQILLESGRLHPERAQGRLGLVSRWLGLEPGGEAYIGHRSAQPENARFPYTPSGGTGRVASPKGMSENKLVLAGNGRLRQSVKVAGEDWHSAQVFRQANQAREDLGNLGSPFNGNVPAGHSLVNPKGRTVPINWKTEDLAQFKDSYEDVSHIRDQAQKIVDGFVAKDPEAFAKMKQDALAQGVNWDELRVVPNRLIDRYYAQFRPKGSRGGFAKVYDSMIDAVSTSIVFARIGYIPKNLVQNIVMAVPHQGPFLLQNAVWAGQAARDAELRRLIGAEVGGTGPTGALAREAFSKRVTGAVAGFMSKGADEPIRFTAFLHEAAAAGVIPRTHLTLTEADRQALIDLLTNPAKKPLLNDIRSRTVEAMADFSRLTPDQSRVARRVLIIPGWLMAGTRYPFHFALTHPVRSALLAYIAMGEPGAPSELQFNHPLNEYFHGSGYKQGIDTPWGRLRTNSLSPVSTPYDLAQSVLGSIHGKTGPFDFTTPTAFDEIQPLLAATIGAAQGEGIKKSVERLAPDLKLVQGLIHPKASSSYPEDATRLGRLRREIGILPIAVSDAARKRGRSGGVDIYGGGSTKGGSSGGIDIFARP